MTDELGLLQPFVWINAFTPESPDKRQVLPLTGSVLVSFTDESLFDIEAAPGGERSKTGRAKVRFELFDANFTYLETLFLLNKRRVEVEYGWLDQNGKVASSSGVFPVTLVSIKPKFTFQGTQLEIIAVSDLSSSSPPGTIEHFYSTHMFSITFVPEAESELYGGKYPHLDFANPATQKKKEDRITTRVNDVLNGDVPRPDLGPGNQGLDPAAWSGTPGFNLPEQPIVPESSAENAANTWSQIRADLSNKNMKYISISQLVRSIAKSLGMKSEVDVTKVAPPSATLPFINKTIMNILSGLASEAESSDGSRDYRFWIRGDTIYFKRPVPKDTFNRVFNYGVGISLGSTSAANKTNKDGVVLGVEVDIQPNLIVNSAWAQAVTTTIDATNKAVRGGNVVPPHRKIKDTVDASIVRNVTKVDTSEGTLEYVAVEFVPPEGMTSALMVQAEEFYYSKDWLLWDQATQIAADALESLERKFGDDIGEINSRYIFSQSRILAYNLLEKDRQDRLAQLGDTSAEVDVASSLADAAAEQSEGNATDFQKKDLTLVGRRYISPHQDERAAGWAKAISNSASQKVFKAKLLALGDVSIRLMHVVTLNMLTPEGPHYASGDYLVLGVSNAIDASGFTTELTLMNAGGITATSSLKSTTTPNEKFRPSIAPKPTTWTDVQTTPASFPVKDAGPEDAAEDQLILDNLVRKGTRPK